MKWYRLSQLNLTFVFSLFNRDKLRNGSEMTFVVGAAKINISNLKTWLELDVDAGRSKGSGRSKALAYTF